MIQKVGDFLFWSMPEPMVTFLGLNKNYKYIEVTPGTDTEQYRLKLILKICL